MDHFPKGKKAQITVFIIIGIILVFSVGIYGYLRTTGIGPGDVFQPKSPPVVEFVDACLERTAADAIRIMGDQGGYIYIPLDIGLNPTRHVSLFPGVGGDAAPKVPYWYFDGETQIPSLRYMELEVEHFINDYLAYCLQGFEAMSEEYIITEKSNFSANVVFTDKETVVGLDYKLDIQPRGKEDITTKEQFLVKLDVKVKRMWELSKELLEAENQETFFEEMTINLMAAHPPEDIPFTGMSLDCRKRQWPLSEIKRKLIDALEPAVYAIRFRNTDHPPFSATDDAYEAVHEAVTEWRESETAKPLRLPKNVPEDSYDYFQYYFDFTDKNYKDLKVVSTYKREWGMNLLATPSQNGILRSGVQNLKSKIISFLLCLQKYHFVYDITYPVMININDPNAFHRTGYVFRFAFPVQIFHNAPDRSLLPTKIIEPAEYVGAYCDFYGTEEHTVIVRDVVTNAELSKVDLNFKCLRDECILGTTRSNNRHLQWSGRFPAGCSGALIIANRSGYLEAEKQHDGSEPFFMDMYPTQPVMFDVRRHPENAPGSERRLDPDMYAIIQVESKDPPLSVFDVFGGREIFNRTDTFDLLRTDATYDLNIMLMKSAGEEDTLVGGWIGEWNVKTEDILDAEKVVFHIFEKYPAPKTDEDMVEVFEIMTNRSLHPDILPELIRADEYTGEEDVYEEDTQEEGGEV
jgi:hypothetical protein